MSRPAARISRIASWVPTHAVSNEVFETRFGYPRGSIARRTGLESRRTIDERMSPTEMGVHAVRRLFDDGLDPESVDMIISAGTSRDQSIPPDAMVYAHKLGLPSVQCLHLESVCLSFLAALEVADLYIRSGKRTRVLVISSEITSLVADQSDPSSAFLLGDGAAAAVVETATGPEGIEAIRLRTEAVGEAIAVATIEAGGLKTMPGDPGFDPAATRFHVDGPMELKLAREHLPGIVEETLGPVDLADVDHVIPHQVVPKMIRAVLTKFSVDPAKIHVRTDYGNQAAAGIPVVLSELLHDGTIRSGHRVLLVGGAAGFSVGAALLRF
jgi:3-oxoacyl-[acyl-carrier-protein] synthase-3